MWPKIIPNACFDSNRLPQQDTPSCYSKTDKLIIFLNKLQNDFNKEPKVFILLPDVPYPNSIKHQWDVTKSLPHDNPKDLKDLPSVCPKVMCPCPNRSQLA